MAYNTLPQQSLVNLKADYHTGVMVCFYLPPLLAKRLAIPNGLPPEELHLTLAYLGDVNELDRPDKLLKDLAIFADNNPPLEGNISGVGRFNNPSINSGQAEHPFYASFDSPALPGFRQRLIDFLQLGGWPVANDHGFTPHITLAYLSTDQDNPLTVVEPIYTTFDTLSLTLGNDIYDLPLTGLTDGELREAVRVVQMANRVINEAGDVALRYYQPAQVIAQRTPSKKDYVFTVKANISLAFVNPADVDNLLGRRCGG